MKKYLAAYGKPRYLGIFTYDGDITRGTLFIAESTRGEEFAVVIGEINDEQEVAYRLMRNASEHGDGINKSTEPVVTDIKFKESASDEDAEDYAHYREEEKQIFKEAKEILALHQLDMKLIDVEYLRGKKKLFFYFSSEQRVDFRAYVRDLARQFKTRIELRQIGVRDEAKIISGIGQCGRPCCCSSWLNQFAPIGIKMVKEQNLALNPSKISGICGRLMCCLYYEHEAYHEAWEGFPASGSKIKTPTGAVTVTGIDLPSHCLRCFVAGKGEVKVARDQFDEFKEKISAGEEWVPPVEEETIEDPDDLDAAASKNKEISVKIPNIFERANIYADAKEISQRAEQKQREEKQNGKKNRKHPPKHERERDENGEIPESTIKKKKPSGKGYHPQDNKQHAPERAPKTTPHRRHRGVVKRGRDRDGDNNIGLMMEEF